MAKGTDAAASAVEQLWILWSAFHDGAHYARSHPAVNPYLDADHVVTTATAACKRRYVSAPLDQAMVHSAYTYGWMAGYLAIQNELPGARDESPLPRSGRAREIPRETGGEQLRNIAIFPHLIHNPNGA